MTGIEFLTVPALVVALFCSGLSAGTAYATFFWFKPGSEQPSAWFAELQYAVPRIGIPLFLLQPLAFLGSLTSAVFAWGAQPTGALFALGALLFFIAGLVTRVGHIPINERVKTWRLPELPPDAPATRARWWKLHVARTVLLLVGFGSIVSGALTRHA